MSETTRETEGGSSREPEPRFPLSVEIPVQWGDMDAFGHVNNAVFLRWFESARVAYFVRAGGWLATGARTGPVLAHMEIDYRRAVTFPDTVRADIRMARLGTTSFEFRCRMTSAAQQALVAEAMAVGVFFDFEAGRPAPVPDELRERVRVLEAGG